MVIARARENPGITAAVFVGSSFGAVGTPFWDSVRDNLPNLAPHPMTPDSQARLDRAITRQYAGGGYVDWPQVHYLFTTPAADNSAGLVSVQSLQVPPEFNRLEITVRRQQRQQGSLVVRAPYYLWRALNVVFPKKAVLDALIAFYDFKFVNSMKELIFGIRDKLTYEDWALSAIFGDDWAEDLASWFRRQ